MSLTGSLLAYDNNNASIITAAAAAATSFTTTTTTTTTTTNKPKQTKRTSILRYTQYNNNKKAVKGSSIESKLNGSFMGKTTPSSLNSSISNSIITNASSNQQQQQHQHQQQSQQQQQHHQNFPITAHLPAKLMNSKRKHAKYNNMYPPHMYPDHNNYLHLNSLWSIWYGVLLTLFQGYLAVHGAYRFLGCSLISWKIEPVTELNLQIVLSGVVFILLPFFFTSAVFKDFCAFLCNKHERIYHYVHQHRHHRYNHHHNHHHHRQKLYTVHSIRDCSLCWFTG
uniref:Uncharacterized protein n=1 Tax=Glossina brevipalpis TaxID=37001 RepID=A0A1A9WMK3_9MUSC